MSTKIEMQKDASPYAEEALGQIFFNEKEIAKCLNLSEETLRRGRLDGKRQGHIETPKHTKIGRLVRYHISDVKSWIKQQLEANVEGARTNQETSSQGEMK